MEQPTGKLKKMLLSTRIKTYRALAYRVKHKEFSYPVVLLTFMFNFIQCMLIKFLICWLVFTI